MSTSTALLPRVRHYRCALIIAAYERRISANHEGLKQMLGARGPVLKGQYDRALTFLGASAWPDTCGNTRGIEGLGDHDALSSRSNHGLGAQHFEEPWHLFCKDCNDALARIRGHEIVRPPPGPFPPDGWKKFDPV